MRRSVWLACCSALLAAAHEGHGEAPAEGSYMEKHMAVEHHIDAFDQLSFFKLHDLNRDEILDVSELEAIYGLHHEDAREHSDSDDQHQTKTQEIIGKVLSILDQNGDGVVTKREFLAKGREALPDFADVPGLGHHYDTEGEYFLHHEELYHNTAETQTDEAYVHDEDIKHFSNHDKIEAEEDALVLKAQGLPPDPEVEKARGASDEEVAAAEHFQAQVQEEGAEPARQAVFDANEKARQERAASAQAQAKKYRAAAAEAAKRGPWEGNGFKRPKDKADRLRVGVPAKFRIKRGSLFGDFCAFPRQMS